METASRLQDKIDALECLGAGHHWKHSKWTLCVTPDSIRKIGITFPLGGEKRRVCTLSD